MNNIVVLTFHSVLNHTSKRPWAFLSTSLSAFENTLKYLKKRDYQTITLRELYDWKKNGKEDDIKRVLIHFDDGFLDNYTVVYPLLKKYGFQATVFISPDFVDPRHIIRETQYDNIKAGHPVREEDVWGYMSWEELRKIDSEGVIDVQSHAMTHTWYYCSPELVDWHHEKDKYYWMYWNAKPEKKPYWLTQYDAKAIQLGEPVFKYEKAMSGKRFFPSSEVIDFCRNYYTENQDIIEKNKKKAVFNFNKLLQKQFGDNVGTYETDQEFEKRLKIELIKSKELAERYLDKKIEFLAWPGGAVSENAYKIARSAGYLAWTKKFKPYNEISDCPSDIYRVGGWSGIKFPYNPSNFIEYWFIKIQLHRAKGNKNLINRVFAALGNIYRKRYIHYCKRSGELWK